MRKRMEMAGIRYAVGLAGSQTALAKALGVSNNAVSKWVRQGFVPNNRVKEISEMYGIPRARLCNPAVLALVYDDDNN